MQVLNLIRPEKSSIKYKVIQFPDGEPHIVLKDIDRKDYLSVICRICNPTDLFILMQVGDILNRQGVLFSLNITYLMSMRMDRVISYDESFSLSIVAQVINNMSPQAVEENQDLPLVVIDDLCDGGGTFKGIAQLLESHCPNRDRAIYVTHMVNPKGIATLSENYKEVYFTNSYRDWGREVLPNNVKVIEVV